MLPLSRAARAEADRAPPGQRRDAAKDFFINLLDADADGVVIRGEFVGVAEELFGRDTAGALSERTDRDSALCGDEMKRDLERGDGVVGRSELRMGTLGRAKNVRASRFLNFVDRTGDGRVAPREMRWLFGPMREDGSRTSPFLLGRAKLNLLA